MPNVLDRRAPRAVHGVLAVARRGRTHKRDHLVVLVPIGILGYVLVTPTYGLFVYVLLMLSVLLFWGLFAMPTLCGYALGYRGCLIEIYGKANGCRHHGALKRDAIFAAFRLRNPGQLLRVKWQDGPVPKWRTVGVAASPPPPQPGPSERSNARKAKYDLVMLLVATVGSLAGVLALFVAK